MRRTFACSTLALGLTVLAGCGAGAKPPARPCDAECRDTVAVRALRETMKLAYNLTLQANPVGEQDESTPCPGGGTARVFGQATSNPVLGTTEVDLTYVLDVCAYLVKDDEPAESYDMTSTGTVVQTGVIAVQPDETTALVMSSDSVTLAGSVYDPAVPFTAEACAVALGQAGDVLSGKFCGRDVGVDL